MRLKSLFRFIPNVVVPAAEPVRIMLSTQKKQAVLQVSTPSLSFRGTDIEAVYDAMAAKGVVSERAPALTTRLPDQDLWIGFVGDPTGILLD